MTGVGEARKPWPRHEGNAGQQAFEDGPHGSGAEQHRLLAAAAVEHAIGEDVAALEIGAELHLVDGKEGDLDVVGHRLDGRHPVARLGWNDLLLAGDQRHGRRALGGDGAVVVLARQQAERQADHAGLMSQHALDGEMRLARVGRAEHGGHVLGLWHGAPG